MNLEAFPYTSSNRCGSLNNRIVELLKLLYVIKNLHFCLLCYNCKLICFLSVLINLITFRTKCGQYVVACSLDGTIACCQFSLEEIGKSLPLEEKVNFST